MDVKLDRGALCTLLAVISAAVVAITCRKGRKTRHEGSPEKLEEDLESEESKQAGKKAKRRSKVDKKKKEPAERKKIGAEKEKEKEKEPAPVTRPIVTAPVTRPIPTALKSVKKEAAVKTVVPGTVAAALTERTARAPARREGEPPGSDLGDGEYEDVNIAIPKAAAQQTALAADSELKTVVSAVPAEDRVVDAAGEGEKPIIDATSKDAISLILKVEPPKATFKPSGGVSVHTITNKGLTRLVYKIKCSNNNEYGIHPVYGFIEPMSSSLVMITRLPGIPKEDKMVIQWVEAAADAKDPREAFKVASPWTTQSVRVTLEIIGDTAPAQEIKAIVKPLRESEKPSAAAAIPAKPSAPVVPVKASAPVPAAVPATAPKPPALTAPPAATAVAASKPPAPTAPPVAAPATAPKPPALTAPPAATAVAAPKPPAPTAPPVAAPATAPKPSAVAVSSLPPAAPAAAVAPPKPTPKAPVAGFSKDSKQPTGTLPSATGAQKIPPTAPPKALPTPSTKVPPPAPSRVPPTAPPKVPSTTPLMVPPITSTKTPPPAQAKVPPPIPLKAAPSSKETRPGVAPLPSPMAHKFPIPEGPLPAPPAGVGGSDGGPVMSVYAVGGNAGQTSNAPASLVLPGVAATSQPRKK